MLTAFQTILIPLPYYRYQFSDDSPLDIAANSRGVVFSHSIGDDTVMLALYDDNHDGYADSDELLSKVSRLITICSFTA